jgi:hypothetical protein
MKWIVAVIVRQKPCDPAVGCYKKLDKKTGRFVCEFCGN